MQFPHCHLATGGCGEQRRGAKRSRIHDACNVEVLKWVRLFYGWLDCCERCEQGGQPVWRPPLDSTTPQTLASDTIPKIRHILKTNASTKPHSIPGASWLATWACSSPSTLGQHLAFRDSMATLRLKAIHGERSAILSLPAAATWEDFQRQCSAEGLAFALEDVEVKTGFPPKSLQVE